MCVRVSLSHLLAEPGEDVLLRDHLEPVALHLLAQVGVLTLLELDQRPHLAPEGITAQAGQTLAKHPQELLDLQLHKL